VNEFCHQLKPNLYRQTGRPFSGEVSLYGWHKSNPWREEE